MNYYKKELPKSQIELEVTITSKELGPYLEKSAQAISKDLKISGFRPGKAPYGVVKQHVSEQAILEEAAKEASRKTFLEIVQKENLELAGYPKIEIKKIAPDNDLVYKVIVNLIPKVKLGSYKGLKVAKKPVQVNEEDIDKTLNELVKSRVKEKMVDRPIQSGDKAEVDFDIFMDKIPIEDGGAKKYPVVVGDNMFLADFEKQIIGLKKDEKKEFSLKFPKEYFRKDLAGRQADFKVKICSVYQRDLPELNDDFAKSLGAFKSLEELKDQIKNNLQQEAEIKEKQRYELALLEEIISGSQFDEFPEELIDSEKEKMLNELRLDIEGKGFKFDEYLGHIKKTEEDLKKDFTESARKRLQTSLVTRQIAIQEDIKVSDKEIDDETNKLVESYGGQEEIKKQSHNPEHRRYISSVLASQKVYSFLEKENSG